MNLLSSSDDEEEAEPRRVKVFRERINFNLEDPQFKEKFRLQRDEFEFVLNRIGNIIKHNTNLNRALSPTQQLLIALHWFGNGSQYHGLGDMHGVNKSTVCNIVHRVVSAINENLFQEVVNWPSNTTEIAEKFYRKGRFPLVAGCVDGSLINIDSPRENEEQFVDRKNNHSINCMVICGPNHEFYYCNARWPGALHDARVLRNSNIHRHFENGWRPFPNCVLLGDSAYPMKEWLMTPININPDDRTEQRYNRAHKSTRRLVECSLGILKERFPCLHHLRVNPILAGSIIMACVVLHNIANKDDFQFNPIEVDDDNPCLGNPNNFGGRLQEFLDMFV